MSSLKKLIEVYEKYELTFRIANIKKKNYFCIFFDYFNSNFRCCWRWSFVANWRVCFKL